MVDRALLGIDGNCGFALLGPNIQEGEAEFVEFIGDVRTPDGASAAVRATTKAYRLLRERLGRDDISYELDVSHPLYV